jgi:polyisoprenoid-binding protein YceI
MKPGGESTKRIALAAALSALPLVAAAQAETYALDPYHTIPHFSLEYHGYGTLIGRFDKMSGKFTIDRTAKKGGLEFAIEAASVNTGDGERGPRPRSRDEHLRTPDFFNAVEFPRITFKSTNVKFSGDSPAEVEGQLTLLGTTKPLTFRIDRWVCKDHPVYKKPSCGGNATAVFKRSEFGMKYAIPSISDEVRLTTLFLAFRE